MGAARRLCVRAAMLAGMIGAIVSLALPACQFPSYGMANGGGASAGAFTGGVPDDPGGAADGGEASGAAGEGGAAGEAGSDGGASGGEPAMPCAPENCVPRTPDWQGPFALWDSVAVAPALPPDCPEGYANPTDLHHDIKQPTDGCQCTCGAQGQSCNANTTLNIYEDQHCEGTPCATVSSPLTCEAVSTCAHGGGSLKGALPTPSGGSCKEEISPPTPATWQYDSRLCSTSGASVCEDRNQVCAPLPGSSYGSQLCVTRVIQTGSTLPDCPAGYTNRKTLYKTFTDGRSCTACGCSAVTGGACTGSKLSVNAEPDCSNGVVYTLNSTCQVFTLNGNNAHPTSVGTDYKVTAGTCKVTSPSSTTGSAVTTGPATVVCCQ